MARKADAADTVYQLKITLAGTEPPIWRKIQVTGDLTLGDLHRIIQRVMEWMSCHLHEFDIRGIPFGDAELERGPFGDPVGDQEAVHLIELGLTKGMQFLYTYDFGDDWEHIIEVERVLEARPGGRYPLYLGGERAAPPEDVGGTWGYEAALEILKDEDDPEYADWREWLGEWDPDYIDEADIKAWMKAF